MRALAAAALLLALAPALPARAAMTAPPGGRVAPRTLPPQRPLLASQMRSHIHAMARLQGAPQMAAMLRHTLAAPRSTPAQLAAARLLAEALVRPSAAPEVAELLRRDEGAEASEGAREELLRLVDLVREDEDAPAAFAGLLSSLPPVEKLAGLGTEDSFEALQAGLDAFFAGQGARESAELPVSASADEAPVPDAALSRALAPRRPLLRWPAAWTLRRAPKAPQPAPAPRAEPPSPVPAPTPAAQADAKAEVFRVSVGRKPAATVTFGELEAALDANRIGFLDKLVPKGGEAQDRVIRLENGTRRVNVAMVMDRGLVRKTERMVWADFYESDRHPLLAKLSQKFTFAPFRARRDSQIHYELPHIDKDNMQLTTYGLRLSAQNEVLDDETMHIYVGKQFLVTTHQKERMSVKNTLRLLAETGNYKTPREMMALLLGDTIHRYGGVIDTLSQDFAAISEKVGRDASDDSIRVDAVKAGQKIDAIHNTIIRQKHVLEDLLRVNEFHQSEYVPVDAVRRQLAALDQHLVALNHYQSQKNGLVSLYSAGVSNQLALTTRLLTAASVIIGVGTVITGLLGMNVVLPVAQQPYVFWGIVAGLLTVMGGLFLLARRRRWI